jgi:hypothetical protein
MHDIAVVSDLRVRTKPRARRRGPVELVLAPAALGAWRNWWAMSVVEDPPLGSRQTHVIGARGRMVPPR